MPSDFSGIMVCIYFSNGFIIAFQSYQFYFFSKFRLVGMVFGQITIFQYYTPNLLRNFGVGTPNGSLWTIPVELEFYILLPVFFLFLKHISIKVKFIALFCFLQCSISCGQVLVKVEKVYWINLSKFRFFLIYMLSFLVD